jgi:hypothetical protein
MKKLIVLALTTMALVSGVAQASLQCASGQNHTVVRVDQATGGQCPSGLFAGAPAFGGGEECLVNHSGTNLIATRLYEVCWAFTGASGITMNILKAAFYSGGN